jgi:membrane protein required for colicin V production
VVLDVLILLVIGIGAFLGFRKGLLIEIISLLAFILATMIAFKLVHVAVGFIKPYLDHQSATPVAGFILTFIGVFFLIFWLGKFLTKMLHYTLVGSFDKFAGALLGAVKYTFFLSVLLWLMHISSIDKFLTKWTPDSMLYSFVLTFAKKLLHIISYIIPFDNLFEKIKQLL